MNPGPGSQVSRVMMRVSSVSSFFGTDAIFNGKF